MRKLPSVRAVTAVVEDETIQQVSQYATTGGTVKGIDTYYPSIRALPIAEGRLIDSNDLHDRRHVVVLGQKTAQLLFSGRPALGEWILLNGSRFQVVGVAAKTGRGNNNGVNQTAYIPLYRDDGDVPHQRRKPAAGCAERHPVPAAGTRR